MSSRQASHARSRILDTSTYAPTLARAISLALRNILATTLFISMAATASAAQYSGRVVDNQTRKPIANAIVTLENTVVQTGNDGLFHIQGSGDSIGVRAYGYLRS